MSLAASAGASRPSVRRLLIIGLGLISTCIAYSAAQGQAAPTPAEADESSRMAVEILGFDTVEARERDAISRDLDAVREEISDLESRLNSARPIESAAKWRMEPKKKIIDAIKSNLDLAKKERRESDVLRLESLKKRAEAELKFLERVAGMRTADVKRLEKGKEYADARKKALDLELMLNERRAAFKALPEGDPTAPTRQAELYEFEKQALAALSDAAEKGSDAAGRAKEFAEKRNEVYEAIVEYRKLP